MQIKGLVGQLPVKAEIQQENNKQQRMRDVDILRKEDAKTIWRRRIAESILHGNVRSSPVFSSSCW